jgi:hypothetical protein
MDDFKTEFSLFELTEQINEIEQKIKAKAIKINNQHLFHRLNSEQMIEDILPLEVEQGASYHVISNGDIDSFSYLMWILRMQKVRRLLCSTWCMARLDIEEFHRQIMLGRVGELSFYLGEIFPGSYPEEYAEICEVCRDSGGRVAVFRNHSKVMAGHGEKFSFVIESSANINTNPRTEQTVITINTELTNFYFEFYEKIISFDKDWR